MEKGTRDEVTIQAAAKLADRSAETLRRWVWSGRLNARKSGKRLLVSRSDVEALARPGDVAKLSLRDWADLAERVLKRPARGGRSASDLILADRRERSGN